MTHSFSISYIACQTCPAKIHCDQCEKQLEEALMRSKEINGASVQIGAKSVLIDSDLDADTLEELLENLGIFVT